VTRLDDKYPIPGTGRDVFFFFFATASRPALGPTQPPIQWVQGALSPGIKRMGPEAKNSAPFSAEIRTYGAIAPLPNTCS